mgnify:CR=1 FL=1
MPFLHPFGFRMASTSDNTRGIVAMNIAMFGFIGSDTLVKYITQSLPLGETVFLRGIVASVLVAIVVAWTGSWRAWRSLIETRMVLRIVGELGATITYLVGLVHMPIANATAVFQATPLVMTACAAVFLGERVGPERWVAIAVGLLGVMVIVRPGLEGFDVWSLAILAAVACVALRDIATARISSNTPTSLVTLVTAVSVTVLGVAMMPFEQYVGRHVDWTVPTPFVAAMVVLNAASLLSGYVGILVATRLAETSAIAPFRYTLLVWSFLFGVLVFGQYPDTATMVGAAIVVATGLYSFHRERTARNAAAA